MTDGSLEFRPLSYVARADMAAFLHRLAVTLKKDDNSYTPTSDDYNIFTDVNMDGDYHQVDILWLANNNISEGWLEADGTKTFRPLNEVARADMAAFIRRLAKKYNISDADTYTPTDEDLNAFKDVDKDTPHYEDILWLYHSGISTGWVYEDGSREFKPLSSVARCDMAAFLHRLANLNNN